MVQPDANLLEDLEPTYRGVLTNHGAATQAFARWDHPSPRGRVVIAHGYGEHGERYRHTAQWLHRQGWSVSACDFRGFGRSGGIRGDAAGIRPLVEDLAFFLRQERVYDAGLAGVEPLLEGGVPVPPPPACPQVLLGHSFGGLVATLALLWHADTLDGLILSSPALKLREIAFPLKVLQGLLYCVAPHRPLNLPGDKSLVCSDPGFVQRYWADPLCHTFITAAFFAALQEGRKEILNLGSELDRPILLLEAGEDTVVDPDGAEALWSAVPAGLLERHRLAGFRHELFHDLRREEVERLTSRWLDDVFPSKPGTKSPLAAILNEDLKENP